jgi:prevent-host-death family protein
METINVADAREQFADLMGRVAYGGERIIVQRRGKPMMAWISLEDLGRLEAFEQNASPDDAPAQAAELAKD